MQELLFKREIGDFGEDLAYRHLEENGYEILERNFKTPVGEIDIVAKKKGVLHFFEVKTRRGSKFGTPFEAVMRWKRKHIKKTAEWFLVKNRQLTMPCLFGVIGVDISKTPPIIECIVDAFE